MNREEALEFMVNSLAFDNEENMRAMGVSEDDIKSYSDSNRGGMEYLLSNLYDRMVTIELIKND
jgi:hypothetical protein